LRVELYILDTRLDTFENQKIELNSSITNSQDLDKISTEFTKTFTIPASKRNNQFFKHYYNADIDNTYDARTKKSGRIDLNGLPYKYGKYRLLKVEKKLNKPSGYTVTFVGNLVDIKKELKKDKLKDLELSILDHVFDGANVLTGLQSSLSSGSIIYTLNPKRQYFYNSNVSDVTNTDLATNIYYNEITEDEPNGIRFTELSPSIKVLRILEAIEAKYNLTFSRDFFGGATFERLYMALVNREGSVGGNIQPIDWDGGDATYMNLVTDIGTYPTNATPASGDNAWFVLKCAVTPWVIYDSVDYRIIVEVNGEEYERSPILNGAQVFRTELESDGFGEVIYEVQYFVEVSQTFQFSANLNQRLQTGSFTPYQENTTASAKLIQSKIVISENMPDLELIKWLTAFFKAYKLIAIPQEDGTIYVQTLNAYYQAGTLWDVTKYVDFKQSFAERGKIFSEINFKFDDPSTILNQQFTKNTGTPYGNESAKFSEDSSDPDAELLDGDTYEIELPFETVILDRLIDVETSAVTNIMYAPLIDEDRKPAVPAPFFHYTTLQTVRNVKYLGDNFVSQKIIGAINTPSHSQNVSGSQEAFLFSSEFSEWSGNLMENTLYNYHKDYILSLFNIKRRDFKFSINLPFFILNRLGLNDVFKIKDRYYRIDNFKTELTDGKSTFTLINSFDNDLSNLITGASAYTIDADGGEIVIIVSSDNATVNYTDSGFGTGWVSETVNKGHVNIIIDKNTDLLARSVYVTFSDQAQGKKQQQVYIYQRQEINVTADNGSITADNGSITADNG